MLKSGLPVLLFILLTACVNPFTTREPEPPDQQNSSYFKSPVTVEIVFENLANAIQNRNIESYIRSFVDSTRSNERFTFIPDQGVAATNPSIFVNWGLADERRYLTQLLQSTPADSGRILRFLEPNKNEGPKSATITQNYELIVHHTRQSENLPVVVRGQAKFWLEINDTGDWAIFQWEDYTNGDDPPWSKLKASFQ